MNDKDKIALLALIVVGVLAAVVLFVSGTDITVLSPKGSIGAKERHLIVVSTLLMLIVVIPVYLLTFVIAWRYREGNQKAKYSPNLDRSRAVELLWWAVPGAIIGILSVITWQSAHQLDPFRPLDSAVKPVEIQVVAMDWKWLFIYPEQNVASVNLVELPVDTPINFKITSDGPMNSFWIPALSGQIYAMAGMTTQLHIDASEAGDYRGSSANISGPGFAGMHFTARAVSPESYNQWLGTIKKSQKKLDAASYNDLAQPSQNNPVDYYATVQAGLFEDIVAKYERPVNGSQSALQGAI